MPVTKPTADASLAQAKTTYIGWGEFNFQLVGNNTFRPQLTEASSTEVITNVKTYKSYSPKDTLEPMTIRVKYNAEIWDKLRVAKEAGTIQKLETSDGFSENAMITNLGEVSADIDGPISELPVTFGFQEPDSGGGSGS